MKIKIRLEQVKSGGEYQIDYNRKNKDRISNWHKEFHQNNRDRINRAKRRKYRENRDKMRISKGLET